VEDKKSGRTQADPDIKDNSEEYRAVFLKDVCLEMIGRMKMSRIDEIASLGASDTPGRVPYITK